MNFDTTCVKNEIYNGVDENGVEFETCLVTWASADAGAAVTRSYKKELQLLYTVGKTYPKVQIVACNVKPYKIGSNIVDATTVVIMHGETLEFALGKQGHQLPEKAVAQPVAENSAEALPA